MVPGMLIEAPEPGARRYGLFVASAGPVDLPLPHGRGGGVRYVPVSCGTAYAYPVGCADGSVFVPEGGKSTDVPEEEIPAQPFQVIAAEECSAVGYTSAEARNRATRRLDAGAQGAVELALWTGNDPNGNDLGIRNLTDTAEDISLFGDGEEITEAVAALEDYAYRVQGYGYTAYIHAPVAVASYAAEVGLVVQEGPRKRTPYGSIWVFGGGYPSAGGAGGLVSAMHITGQVTVWEDPETFVAPVDQVMNRETNVRLLLAERAYAVGFDCLNGRVTFDPFGSTSP